LHIMVVGLNHKTAPVELRERVSISDVELDDILNQFRQTRTVLEIVVLSTCNRTELYAVVNSSRAGEDFLVRFLSDRCHIAPDGLKPHLYVKYGHSAVTHLMKVASGLDSMVIGETQILGQVRNAFLTASDAGATGALLNQLFRKAIHVGKRAQTETTIGQSAVSVSYAAVQLAKKVFGDLRGHRVLVVGAGKMSRLTAQHLSSAGIEQIYIANRTYEKAEDLAEEFGGVAISWDNLSDALAEADIVISSTGSKGYVLSEAVVSEAVKRRHHKPFMLIDIAVPRDIEPSVSGLRNVYLYDIDDLEGVVAANLAERQRQAEVVERMIATALQEYSEWLSEQEVVPLIAAVRAKGTAIQSSVMESLKRKLPDLTERELELIHKHTMSIVNQLLRDPVQNMKELAIASGGTEHVRVFAQLFGLTDEDLRNYSKESWLFAGALENEGEAKGFTDLVKQWRNQLLREPSAQSKVTLHPVLR
jgi:glutamyl-tRNA reductase